MGVSKEQSAANRAEKELRKASYEQYAYSKNLCPTCGYSYISSLRIPDRNMRQREYLKIKNYSWEKHEKKYEKRCMNKIYFKKGEREVIICNNCYEKFDSFAYKKYKNHGDADTYKYMLSKRSGYNFKDFLEFLSIKLIDEIKENNNLTRITKH